MAVGVDELGLRTGKPNGRGRTIETDIPARLDRLPWSRFHTPADISGWAASLYIAGARLGAIVFGQLGVLRSA